MENILQKTSENAQKGKFLANKKYTNAGMEIIAIFNRNIYKEIEPFLYNNFRSFITQKKDENNNYRVTISCCTFDFYEVYKFICSQPNLIHVYIPEQILL